MFNLSDTELLKLNNEVVRLATIYPDATYTKINEDFAKACGLPGCCYSMGNIVNGPDTPGCIIGQAFRNVFPDKFKEISDRELGESQYNERNCGSVMSLLRFPTGAIADFLRKVQNNQDGGNSWGACIKLALA